MTAPRYEWDYDYWPPDRRPAIEYEQDRRGFYSPVRRRPISFLSCVMTVGVATLVLGFFTWRALLMAAVLVGVTEPGTMAGAIIALIFLVAASLDAKLNRRPI